MKYRLFLLKAKFVLWLIGDRRKYFIANLGGFSEADLEERKRAWDVCIAELQKNNAVTFIGSNTTLTNSNIDGNLIIAPGSHYIRIDSCYFTNRANIVPDPTATTKVSESQES